MKSKIAIIIAALTLIGCSEKNDTESKIRDTLVWSQSAELRSLDPSVAPDIYSRRLTTNIFDRLVEKDENMEIVPGLASSWEQVDDTTIIFNLRKGVKFHNGDEMTSEDVKFSLERVMVSPTAGMLFTSIKSVEAPDKYTVIVRTSEPFGALFHHLSHVTASITNKKHYENEENPSQNPMGTGAYKLMEWRPGDVVILEKHEDYYLGKAPIKYVHVRTIPEDNNRVIALETGEVHGSQDISAISRVTILDNDSLTLHEMSATGVSYLGLNVLSDTLKDKRIRQAIAMGINRQDIIDSILMGSVEAANSILGPGVFGYSKDTEVLEYDPVQAKKLLSEAGVDRVDLLLSVSGGEAASQIAQIIQAQLREIEIYITIEQIEWGTFLASTSNGLSDLFMMSWSNSSGDADYSLSSLLHSSNLGGGGNRSFFQDDTLNKIIESGRVQLDEEERREQYYLAQDIINDEVPIYPINFMLANAGISNDIEGYTLSPLNNPIFHRMSFK